MRKIHIITILPESIEKYLTSSVLGRAARKGVFHTELWDPRDFTKDKHKKVDGRPYGGGPGMVLSAEPVLKAVAAARKKSPSAKIIILSPRGKVFTNTYAQKLAKGEDLILIAGRYEGIDARVKKILRAEEISIGPYVLAGGELPALILVECIARHVKGVLGEEMSIEEKRDIAPKEIYTRPEILIYKGKKHKVPKVLLSGHHKKINEFHKHKSKSQNS